MMKITKTTQASDYIFDYKEAQGQFLQDYGDSNFDGGQGRVPCFNG
jgi:hypothetical protein